MKIIYVAGPMRADNAWDQEQNIRYAEEVALRIWKVGAVALCPHTMCRFYQGALSDEIWLEGDFALLKRCDAIYLITGWSQSVGTLQERNVADKNSMPILYDWKDLLKFLRHD